jgi:hypothetical protein
MARSRRRANPFSLFSFQDIITSVMGIILLAALLLAVELVTRKHGASPSTEISQVSSIVAENVSTIRADIAELKKELASMQNDSLAAAGTLVVESESRKKIAQVQSMRMQAELAKLTAYSKERGAELARVEATSFDRRDERRKLELLEAEIRSTIAELEELRSSDRLFYNAIPGMSKESWLIDVSAENIRVGSLPIGQARQSPRLLHTFADVDAALEFMKDLSADGHYFLILVRPSGIDRFDELLTELRERRFDIGFDVIDEDQTVFTESR